MAASRCSASDREFRRRRLKTQTAPRFKKDFDLNGGASLHRDNHVLSGASQHGSRHTCSSCNQLLPVRPAAPVYWVSASIGATRASTPSTLLSQAICGVQCHSVTRLCLVYWAWVLPSLGAIGTLGTIQNMQPAFGTTQFLLCQ
jgi:hypothetical protein